MTVNHGFFEPSLKPVSESVLQEADRLTSGSRQHQYGHPVPNHERIARLWNARLHEKLLEPLTMADVTSLMRLAKEARLIQTPGHRDSLVDIAGYAHVENVIAEAGSGGASTIPPVSDQPSTG